MQTALPNHDDLFFNLFALPEDEPPPPTPAPAPAAAPPPPRSVFEELQEKARAYGVAGLSAEEKVAYLANLPRQRTPEQCPSPAPQPVQPASCLPIHNPNQQTMVYAAVGASSAPPEIRATMTSLARDMESRGYLLRTHKGCDASGAFAAGAQRSQIVAIDRSQRALLDIAREIHPAPWLLPAHILQLIGRDARMLFGEDLDAPVDLLICWTEDGCCTREAVTRETGDCANAILLATTTKIPVINIHNDRWREQLAEKSGGAVL